MGGLKIHFFALLSLQGGWVVEKSELLHYYSLLKKNRVCFFEESFYLWPIFALLLITGWVGGLRFDIFALLSLQGGWVV